jgi:glycosyltransferase involved in cell wall biosynthesis
MSEISIITVVFNAKDDLEKTLNSIKSQTTSAEVIVIDGGSSDGTTEVIKNSTIISRSLSENDNGIYHAMNKGIGLATSKWLYFLNAGDVFQDQRTLETINQSINESDCDVVYGDVIITGKKDTHLNCDLTKLVVHHQGICYKKSLHEQVGLYLVNRKLTIADYLFFNLLIPFKWKKIPAVFAICDGTGVSSKMRSYYSKMCVDFIFGRMSILKLTLFFILYPFYKTGKSVFQLKSLYAK